MNTYKKYCPNVFIAQCEEKYEKGDIITVETKYGKENEHIVFNFVGYSGTKEAPLFCYSITRLDGFNSQERAKSKAAKLDGYADNADKRSNASYKASQEASQEGSDFLSLGEPIKIGHHSENRHRALLERNRNRMTKMMEESDKAENYRERSLYWEQKSTEINLSMPESFEFFSLQLEQAKIYHSDMKKGKIEKLHTYSLTYAKKKVNELQKKVKLASKLWG